MISLIFFDLFLFKEVNGGKKRKGECSRYVEFEKEVVFRILEVENVLCFDFLIL